ncbi:hypothetical protein Pmar_PMAR003672 [Perkinsus marinus ATCC 50983]|uniref:Basic leucine zipper domain-containing protein n=1 Tax=Perkinsus marinus (strain ATCC 50983 / TXsc) TaxID=423536 RepID=C5KHZ7_PERM5|nr:hypothetical protein Pmar_PMAR003672 [Perkinsus marinus ATCC 50983]EER16209.1 hypothetical protein Pmar_PMAR003672 [Perkinsus marinus ATCC 50983]|eukprot:XP_002784413.1 hypothetical protein Pmar_PMAR003672 [Perkinsus marinus ATCC 50983]
MVSSLTAGSSGSSVASLPGMLTRGECLSWEYHDFPGKRGRIVYDSNMPREQLVALKRARKRQLNRESAYRVRQKRKLQSTAYETQLRATRTALEVARKQLADILMERNELRRRLAKYENNTTGEGSPPHEAMVTGLKPEMYVQAHTNNAFGEATRKFSSDSVTPQMHYAPTSSSSRGGDDGVSNIPDLPLVGSNDKSVFDLNGTSCGTCTVDSFGDFHADPSTGYNSAAFDLWASSGISSLLNKNHVLTSGSE